MPTTRSSGVRLVPEPTLMHYKTLEMWLATTDRKDQPEHWILLLRPPNANKCTWYHIDGGYPPSSYRHSIEENRWFNHREMPKQQFICTIRGRDQLEVHRAAQAVPPQHCQQYVVGVLSELETSARELVPRGTAERLSMLVTPNLFEGPTRVVPENEWYARPISYEHEATKTVSAKITDTESAMMEKLGIRPESTLDLYVGITDRRHAPEYGPLMLVPPGSEKCIFIHMADDHRPSTYRHSIEDNKRFNSWSIAFRQKICTIAASDEDEVRKAALAVKPQHCQRYITVVPERLEETGKCLVPKGTAARYRPRIQGCVYEGPVRAISDEEYYALEAAQGRNNTLWLLYEYQGVECS
ncbi:uncharacterized protein BDV17DRAFT_295085 [Aspergillus undulatus]|uniref:uncharacterized protein n=1 Tax=Aspergillus undulatus TaxID=1810928 RepID=UPI003CCDD79A